MIHPKAALIERLQREGRGRPQFVTEREGPEHEPLYRSQVSISGRDYGEGSGSNKREAERRAAEAAMARLDAEVTQSAGKGSEGRAKRRRKGAGGNATSEPSPPFEDEPPALLAIPFHGPWPLYPELLAETLRIAHARVDADLRGDVALAGIEAFALRLYKDTLEDLGEVVSAD